ncbi:MAG TPA: hypothetical protein DCO79_03115 [Spirochaeta sp.]|nr:hypothetical protein [Spirochaeta sp.]
MIEIIAVDTNPRHLEELRWLFLSEWGKAETFESAISAVDDDEIVGGLIFTTYAVPGSDRKGLWINALAVVSEYRRQGIGSRLISTAESEALRNNNEELYVYTDVSGLYLQTGWIMVSEGGKHSVLKKVLN